jgi:hypothetical protein
MALPSQETITLLALDKHQQPVFRVQFLSGGFNLNLLDEAMAFGLHLLKLEPKVVRVGVYERPPDALSSEEPLVIITRHDLARTGQPASRDQPSSGPPPRWARALVWLILGASLVLTQRSGGGKLERVGSPQKGSCQRSNEPLRENLSKKRSN